MRKYCPLCGMAGMGQCVSRGGGGSTKLPSSQSLNIRDVSDVTRGDSSDDHTPGSGVTQGGGSPHNHLEDEMMSEEYEDDFDEYDEDFEEGSSDDEKVMSDNMETNNNNEVTGNDNNGDEVIMDRGPTHRYAHDKDNDSTRHKAVKIIFQPERHIIISFFWKLQKRSILINEQSILHADRIFSDYSKIMTFHIFENYSLAYFQFLWGQCL